MPMQSTPDRTLRIVNTVCTGLMELENIEHYQTTVWLDPSIYGYNELFDFSDSDFSNIEFGDLIDIAKKASRLYVLNPKTKFAFLTHTPQHNDVAEFYMAAKDMSNEPSREIKTFSSHSEAMAWLTK